MDGENYIGYLKYSGELVEDGLLVPCLKSSFPMPAV